MVHFAIGDSEESIKLLRGNILYGHEVEISGAVLSQLEAGKFDVAKEICIIWAAAA